MKIARVTFFAFPLWAGICQADIPFSRNHDEEEYEWPSCVEDCSICIVDGDSGCLSDCSDTDKAQACSQCVEIGYNMDDYCDTESPGECFRGDSTVVVRSEPLRSTGIKPLTELQVGDLVETVDNTMNDKKKWAKVVGLSHSKSSGPFFEIEIDGSDNKLAATEHHTFPACHKSGSGAHHKTMVPAHSLSKGSCVQTPSGKATVRSVTRRDAAVDDKTFTVELEGSTDLMVVGGVVTHAKPHH